MVKVLDCQFKDHRFESHQLPAKAKNKKKLSPFGTPPTQEMEGRSRGGRREQERKEGGCYLHNA